MMRSWENRPDTVVCDEPFYANYLKETGLKHPGHKEVLAHHESNPEKVIEMLTGSCEQAVYYQKQMSHHLLPNIARDWLKQVTNIFLIRQPREMMTSLVKTIPAPSIEETGLPQQLELFNLVTNETGKTPIILDSKDLLQQPKAMLEKLCRQLGIPFYSEMLSWSAGPRETDGIWAPHWYASVEASTGFAPWRHKDEQVPTELESMCVECEEIYAQLAAHKMTVEGRDHAPNI